jgi:pimeloyl-ACP methyl ester carboxylesterase
MEAKPQADWQQSFATVDGCKLALRRGGEGPNLVFLHGAWADRGWAPFAAELATRFSVISPDHPGYGGSETPGWLDDIHDLAFFYLDVLASLALDDVHLVGASLGGWIAAEMAVRSTARIARLSLVAPAGIHVKGVAKPDIFLMSPEELTRTLFADERIAEAALARMPSPDEEEAELRGRYMTARLGWQPRMHDPALAKWLHRIDRPTQLLWGRDDRILPAVYAEHWQRLVPGATIAWLDNCGHLPHIERPAAFVAAIDAFARETAR